MQYKQTAFLLFIILISSFALSGTAKATESDNAYATMAVQAETDPAMLSKLEADAEAGIAKAQFLYGELFNPSGPQETTVQKSWANAKYWYLKAAKQGNTDSQYILGDMYNQGQGVPQDYVEAVKWFRKAAEQGYADAQYNLGVMYDQGLGVPQDYTEAAHWYRKAADNGLGEAQYNLGVLYDNGQGVPGDDSEAMKWYMIAIDDGDGQTQKRANDGLSMDQAFSTPQEISESQRRAKQWWEAHHPKTGQ